MKDKIIYSLSKQDIQYVAQQEIERELTPEEIKITINTLEKKISWYDAIADSIHENINAKVKI